MVEHDELIEEIDVAKVRTLRMFSVGIGNNANAAFLERLANYTQGESLFVSDDNAIESSVTTFFEQVSNPVLVNLQLYFGDNFEVTEMYPKKPTNLFKDQTVYILGKYKKGANTTVSLIGDSKKLMQRYDYPVQFPEESNDYPFVATLWAARAIGEMLNQLKADGNDLEGLSEEVADLAEEHFIVNPYTAHLMLKNMQFLSDEKKGYAPRLLVKAGSDYSQEYAGVTQQKGPNALMSSQTAGHWYCDLYALARQRLARLGIARVHGGGECTHADGRRWYSHRRTASPAAWPAWSGSRRHEPEPEQGTSVRIRS